MTDLEHPQWSVTYFYPVFPSLNFDSFQTHWVNSGGKPLPTPVTEIDWRAQGQVPP